MLMWNKKEMSQLDATLTRVPLTLNFHCQIVSREWGFKVKSGICYISAENGLIATKQKQTYRLNSRPQMGSSGLTLAMTLTLNFQGQIWNVLYGLIAMKRKANISIELQASKVTMTLKGEVQGSNR